MNDIIDLGECETKGCRAPATKILIIGTKTLAQCARCEEEWAALHEFPQPLPWQQRIYRWWQRDETTAEGLLRRFRRGRQR